MRKTRKLSWRDSEGVYHSSSCRAILGLLLVFLISLSLPLSGTEKMATHYQVTAYQQSYGKWWISYFKFEPESGMIQQVFYRVEKSLIIDDKTLPVDLLTKSSRISGAMKVTPDSGPQSLTLKGQWTAPSASGYQQMLEQIHISVQDDPFLNQVDRELRDQLTNAQKIKNKQRESELLEKIRELTTQRNTEKILIKDRCVMPGFSWADRQVEMSCDQNARILQIVQRNGANVDYVCWPITSEQVPFPTDETITKAMNEGSNEPSLKSLIKQGDQGS